MREHLMLGLVFEPAHFGRYFLTENGAIDPFYYSPTHSALLLDKFKEAETAILKMGLHQKS